MRALAATLLLLCVALAGCGGGGGGDGPGPTGGDGSTGSLTGVVVDDAILPVEGADVRVVNGPSTRSAADGTFRFDGLAPGDYFLAASRPGLASSQASGVVVAGETDPDPVRIVLRRIPGANPYLETMKLDGYYECAFTAPVITDSCDFGYRTAYDAVNETTGVTPPGPRSPTSSVNTALYDVGADVQTIVQEAFWETEGVSEMMVTVDSTPIDNACDCSERTYLEVIAGPPTYGRIDGEQVPHNETVAARAFLPFGEPQTALQHEFVILTTLFHGYEAPEGWTFETADQYPEP